MGFKPWRKLVLKIEKLFFPLILDAVSNLKLLNFILDYVNVLKELETIRVDRRLNTLFSIPLLCLPRINRTLRRGL